MALLGFCLVFSSLNLLFYQAKKDMPPLKQITVPAHIQITKGGYHSQPQKRNTLLYNFLDSLKATASGERLLDSLHTRRPGLMDSLLTLKNKLNSNF
ncbi:hypothetical protein [Arachidicoccus sp.]|uniref:hypothetical protein n=1 Tax=Arachidicoccus sp. TaxID=1872624 RepID=UPI003D24195E